VRVSLIAFDGIGGERRLVYDARNSQHVEIVLANLIGDREEPSFLRLRLPVFREDVSDELRAQRVKRLVGVFVQINIQVPCDWIFAGVGGFGGRVVTRAAKIGGKGTVRTAAVL
jgi:hypothetical protein